MGKNFGADTSMYVSTASANLDAADVESAIRKVKQFGSGAATGGPNSEQNVIGYRESAVEAYQGLRVIPGPQLRHRRSAPRRGLRDPDHDRLGLHPSGD
jgi:hypothetical protein